MNEGIDALVTAENVLDVSSARVRESSSLAFWVARRPPPSRGCRGRVCLHPRPPPDRPLRDREAFRAWLVRMTWRLAIDRLRTDRRRGVREMAVEPEPGVSTEDLASAQERARRLWAAIDELPEKLRMAIVLASIEGHDVAEVGRLLDIPEGTVKSRLFLARKQLAEKLQCLANRT